MGAFAGFLHLPGPFKYSPVGCWPLSVPTCVGVGSPGRIAAKSWEFSRFLRWQKHFRQNKIEEIQRPGDLSGSIRQGKGNVVRISFPFVRGKIRSGVICYEP